MSFQFTIPSEHRDFVDWHRGREHYAVWALDLDLPEINSAVEASQRALQDLLLPAYCRQAHLTIALCGFPSAGSGGSADDYSQEMWLRQLDDLSRLTLGSLLLEISSTDSFASAPYLRVRDICGGLAELRRCLNAPTLWAEDSYVPHLTLGLYRAVWPAEMLWQRLARLNIESLKLAISRVHLMSYESRVIGGPLSSMGYFDLAGRQWQSATGALAVWSSGGADGK